MLKTPSNLKTFSFLLTAVKQPKNPSPIGRKPFQTANVLTNFFSLKKPIMHSLTLLKKQVALFTNLIKKTLTLGKKKLRITITTMDYLKIPNSETFKERFLATAKNKDDILEVLTKNKDTWFFSSQLLSLLFFVAVQPTFVKSIIHPPKTI